MDSSSIRAETSEETLDKEDGELSDDAAENGKLRTAREDDSGVLGDESAVPTVSISSETEIDRIIQEAQRELITEANSNLNVSNDVYSGVLPPPPPPPNLIRNMLDPVIVEHLRIDTASVSASSIEELESLRAAALVSMKNNGLEEGEVREEPVVTRPEKQNRTRSSTVDRQTSSAQSENNYRRPRLPSPRRNASSRDWGHRRDRKRDRSTEPRKKKARMHRSSSRDRRRSKERREERTYEDATTPSISTTNAAETPASTPLNPHQRPRSRRNDIEHQKLIFGGELPSQSFAVQQNELQDNHDLVSMDIDSDNHVTPLDSPTRPNRPSIEDESILRTILMEQLNSKKGRLDNTEESELNENLDEKQHKENKKKLQECEQDITTVTDELHKLDSKKKKLMKQLEETYKKLAEQQTKYWEKIKVRNELRPLVEQYEAKKMLQMASNRNAAEFRRNIEEHEKQLDAIAAFARDVGSSSLQNTPSQAASIKLQPKKILEDTDLRIAPSAIKQIPQKAADTDLRADLGYTPEEENEIQLRQILLQKQQGKVNGNQQRSAPSSANQTVEGPEEPPPPVLLSPESPPPPRSPSPEMRTPTRARSPAFEPRTPQRIRSPTMKENNDPSTPEPIMRKLQKYKRFGIPLRLFPHAGLELPQDVEIERIICPFEMTGKCKDVDCPHRHLKDDQLKLREVVAMIVNHYPSLSGRFETETYSAQIDYVLTTQDSGEGRREFIKRLLDSFVHASGILRTSCVTYNDVQGSQANLVSIKG